MFGRGTLLERARKAAADGPEAVRAVLSRPIREQAGDPQVARSLIEVLDEGLLPPDETARLYGEILDAHGSDTDLILFMGLRMEAARDIDDLNAAPSDAPVFARMIARLSGIQLAASDPVTESGAVEALASTARLMARQKDDVADRAHTRLIELNPDASWAHYVHGLYLKTRGRFAASAAANRRAIDLSKEPTEAMLWNLGIAATGAGDGQTALGIWRDMGNKLEIGPDGLPEGSYPACKVRLAQRPLAERDAAHDDPGSEESIWVQRLSPCHGIVRSVLYDPDLGTDYGDTVLFDGAPITHHRYGDRQVPVFPHLATLARGGFRYYAFSATQTGGTRVDSANDRFDTTLYIYSHTESMYSLCAACWRDESVEHARHEPRDHTVIHGRIAVGPNHTPAGALARIDAALAAIPGARLFAPDLCNAAGDTDRAAFERNRFDRLRTG